MTHDILTDFIDKRIQIDNMQKKIVDTFNTLIKTDFPNIEYRFLRTEYRLTFHELIYCVNNIAYKINIPYSTFINIASIDINEFNLFLTEHIRNNINKAEVVKINNIMLDINNISKSQRTKLFAMLVSKYGDIK